MVSALQYVLAAIFVHHHLVLTQSLLTLSAIVPPLAIVCTWEKVMSTVRFLIVDLNK
jgi:hypothetical protein